MHKNFVTQVIVFGNGQQGQDDIVDSPCAFINDGLCEYTTYRMFFDSLSELGSVIKKNEEGGLLAYDKKIEKVKQMTIYNRNYDSEGYLIPQYVCIDGELYISNHFVHQEIIPDNLEVIVNVDQIIEDNFSEPRYRNKRPEKSFKGLVMFAGLLAAGYACYANADKIKDAVKDAVDKLKE